MLFLAGLVLLLVAVSVLKSAENQAFITADVVLFFLGSLILLKALASSGFASALASYVLIGVLVLVALDVILKSVFHVRIVVVPGLEPEIQLHSLKTSDGGDSYEDRSFNVSESSDSDRAAENSVYDEKILNDAEELAYDAYTDSNAIDQGPSRPSRSNGF